MKKYRDEDVMNELQLDRNKSYNDWDMLVAVAVVFKDWYDKEKNLEENMKMTSNKRLNEHVKLNMPRKETETSKRLIESLEEEQDDEEHVIHRKRRRVCKRLIFESSDDIDEEVDISRPKKKIKRKKKNHIELPNPVPDLPDDIMKKITDMGGTNIKLVIVKALTYSDCDKGKSRLSMPASQVVDDFLEENEKAFLDSRGEISVELISSGCKDTPIPLKIWVMPKKKTGQHSKIYVLTKPWLEVLEDNKFKENGIIQVRSFRVAGQLKLAIARVS